MARTKGATHKPRITDYIDRKQVDALVAKAMEMATNGDQQMLKLMIEQYFGKAPQAMEITGPDGGAIEITTKSDAELAKLAGLKK